MQAADDASGRDADEADDRGIGAVVWLLVLLMWLGWALCAYVRPFVSVLVVYPVVVCTLFMIARGARR